MTGGRQAGDTLSFLSKHPYLTILSRWGFLATLGMTVEYYDLRPPEPAHYAQNSVPGTRNSLPSFEGVLLLQLLDGDTPCSLEALGLIHQPLRRLGVFAFDP